MGQVRTAPVDGERRGRDQAGRQLELHLGEVLRVQGGVVAAASCREQDEADPPALDVLVHGTDRRGLVVDHPRIYSWLLGDLRAHEMAGGPLLVGCHGPRTYTSYSLVVACARRTGFSGEVADRSCD